MPFFFLKFFLRVESLFPVGGFCSLVHSLVHASCWFPRFEELNSPVARAPLEDMIRQFLLARISLFSIADLLVSSLLPL